MIVSCARCRNHVRGCQETQGNEQLVRVAVCEDAGRTTTAAGAQTRRGLTLTPVEQPIADLEAAPLRYAAAVAAGSSEFFDN